MSDGQQTVNAPVQDRSTYRMYKYILLGVAIFALHILPFIGPLLIAFNVLVASIVTIQWTWVLGAALVFIGVRLMFSDRVNTGRTGWDWKPGCVTGLALLGGIVVIVLPILAHWQITGVKVMVAVGIGFIAIGVSNGIANRK